MRNPKFFSLALVAVVAVVALMASAAAANQFHSTATNTTVTRWVNQHQTFSYENPGHTIQCTTVGGSGSATAQTVSEFTFSPTYSGCSASGIAFSSAEVSMANCDYLFTIQAISNSGPVHIKCPETKNGKGESLGQDKITITVKVFGVSICTLHIGEQTPEGVAFYENVNAAEVNVQPILSGIVGTRQGSEECGAAKSTTGSYTGSVQVKGEETGTQNAKNIQVG